MGMKFPRTFAPVASTSTNRRTTVITKKKRFELMNHPVAKIPEIRKQVEEWAQRHKHEITRIHYGIEHQHQTIDVVTVEYKSQW